VKELRTKMFNRKASDPRYKPDQVIEAIAARPGMVIADIGSGGGYYSIRFSEVAGYKGRVYAVDTNKGYLDFISSAASQKGIKNITAILSDGRDMEIPEKSLDFVFMRNVTHHIHERTGYFRRLKKYLKPGSRVAVIDYKEEIKRKILFRRLSSHYVSRDTLVQELAGAGYRIEEEFGFLPEQNFIIFSPE
jgi:arsenite methyltransferase